MLIVDVSINYHQRELAAVIVQLHPLRIEFQLMSLLSPLISQLRLCHAAKHVICSELCIMSNYN